MVDRKIADPLDEQLDRSVATWKPQQPGDTLKGRVRSIEKRTSRYDGQAPYPYVEILTDDGEIVGWHAGQVVARNRLQEQRPRVGERIGVRYLGDERGYKDFRIAVEREQPQSIDWSQMNSASVAPNDEYGSEAL